MSFLDEALQRENAVVESSGSGSDSSPIRRVVRFSAAGAELEAALGGAVACPLLEWAAISIAGADAATFLQGQFTNDVADLAVGAVQWSGYCSPKGRLLANFPLARTSDSDYVLVMPADIAAGFVRRLRMFVLRAKVVVTPLAESHLCFGLHATAAADTFVPPGTVVRDGDGVLSIGMPDGRTLVVCDAAAATGYWQQATRTATRAGSPVWDWLAIRNGIPVVTAATQDRFVPQMLNWELLGGVNFRKGCYTGQEIVARMQYLGRLKERLYRGRTTAPIAPGAPLYGERFGDQACGTIVNAAPSPEGSHEVLAVIQTASAEADAIRTGHGADAAVVELLTLPYDVPARAAQPG